MNAAQTGALRDGVLPRRWRQCLFIGLLALPGLVFLFYVVENWRGKNAWEKYKTELQAQGEKLEVKDFIPPPIPDEQNILTLPIMAGWRGQTSATGRRIQIPDSNQVDGDWGNGRFTDLLEWKAWLQKKKPAVTSSSIFPGSTKADEVVDLVSFDDTPLEEAVRVLARQAGVKIQFSPGVVGAKLQGVKISLRFEHVTARQVLLTLLDNYSLALTNVEATAGFRVINKAEVDGRFRVVSKPPEEFDYAAYGQRLATNAAPADTNEVLSEVSFKGVASLAEAIRAIARQAEINIILDPKVEADISRINLRWKNITAVQALQKLLGEHRYMLWPASTDPIVWRVVPRPARAAVVLEDFKEFADEFEELHEACRRPKERYDLDSETSFKNTIHPNFIRARTDCQALALRASAALAVNDPERATQDVFDCLRLSRVAQAHPTLIGTMIHAAIVGLVTQPIWEGVASHRWTQAQLVELQKQLSAIDLLSDMAAGLRVTRAWTGQGLENDSREELSTNYVYARDQSLSWEQFKQRWTIRLCPGGWLKQSELIMAKSIQSTVESMDLKGQRVSSAKLNAASNIVARAFPPFGLCTANYSRAVQTTVRNQTGINQAIIACALERYRLAHAEYPEKLETLVPEFIPQLPHEIFNGQPLKYHRDDKEQFTLYSIGWDEKDDGGTPAASYGSGPDDWVWHYPAAN